MFTRNTETKRQMVSKLAKNRVSSWPDLIVAPCQSSPQRKKFEGNLRPSNNNQKRDHESRDLLNMNNGIKNNFGVQVMGETYDRAAHADTNGELHLSLHGHPHTRYVLSSIRLCTHITS